MIFIKVYLIWETIGQDYYDVVKIFDDPIKAENWKESREKVTGYHYRIEEKEVE